MPSTSEVKARTAAKILIRQRHFWVQRRSPAAFLGPTVVGCGVYGSSADGDYDSGTAGVSGSAASTSGAGRFSMRITSTVKRSCKSDVLIIQYQDRCCCKHGFEKGSKNDPKNVGEDNVDSKDKVMPELRTSCTTYIKVKWCETKMTYVITS
ncbi:hypothetical protein LINGRAPRIM_LOCUS659 [Linum grandiflorum]